MKIDKIEDNAVFFILSIAYTFKHSTQQEMADYYFEKTGQRISRYAVARLLKILGITRKKTSYSYTERLNYKERTEEFKKAVDVIADDRDSIPLKTFLIDMITTPAGMLSN